MKRMDQRGFSMVEMMVVIAIIGVLATLGVPSLVRMVPRIRLANQATQLANEIAGQRMQAIAKSTDFRMVFDATGDSYTLEKWDGAAFKTYARNTLGGVDLAGASGFDPDPPGNVLVVYGYGGASVPLGTKAVVLLRSSSGDNQKRVLVEATGRAVVERLSPTGAWVAD